MEYKNYWINTDGMIDKQDIENIKRLLDAGEYQHGKVVEWINDEDYVMEVEMNELDYKGVRINVQLSDGEDGTEYVVKDILPKAYGKSQLTQEDILTTIAGLAIEGGLSEDGWVHTEGSDLVIANRKEIEDGWANVAWLWKWNDNKVEAAFDLILEWDMIEAPGVFYLDGMTDADAYWEWWYDAGGQQYKERRYE